MFVLAVENGSFECGLKLVDGGVGDVIGDLLGMFGPEKSEMLACGMEGRPFFFVQVLMASRI